MDRAKALEVRMKRLSLTTKPMLFADIKAELGKLGVGGVTVTETSGYGRQGGHVELYRGAEYVVDLVPKITVEILVSDAQVEQVIAAVRTVGGSSGIGAGKMWITPVDDTVRIRTGETGHAAIA